MPTNEEKIIEAPRARARVNVAELDHAEWERVRPVRLTRYWSGEAAPFARQAEARLLWDEGGLSARFICEQREPIVASASPQREWKTVGLWERDVCELFVAPRADDPSRYFEFEVAPTGEWLDLALRVGVFGRETDWGYYSGMTAAARIAVQEMNTASTSSERPSSTAERRIESGATRAISASLRMPCAPATGTATPCPSMWRRRTPVMSAG